VIINENFRSIDLSESTGDIVTFQGQIKSTNFGENAYSNNEPTPMRFSEKPKDPQKLKGKKFLCIYFSKKSFPGNIFEVIYLLYLGKSAKRVKTTSFGGLPKPLGS
jgi:hypothetical protein